MVPRCQFIVILKKLVTLEEVDELSLDSLKKRLKYIE